MSDGESPGPALPDEQAEILAFLGSGAAFGGPPPRRIDTHAAAIFLVGDRAWKLKRAVRFNYLDFSTPDRRRSALAAELRLNRRTAPKLYLGLHSVTRTCNGSLRIDGDGPPVDWLLEMRRFADGALLSEVADRGCLDDRLLVRLADRIQAFHAAAEIVSCSDGADRLARVIEGNAHSLARFPALARSDLCVALLGRQRERLAASRMQLDERARAGRIAHVYGDLHLANVALIDGEPTPFDCLEFDPELATTDILYDLAFLLADLWGRGLRRESGLVANRYLDLSPQDESGLALLPLFMSLRATVRAHVAAAQSGDDGEALRLLEVADALLRPEPLHLVAIGGLSGTGKTSLAHAICGFGAAPGARVVRSDVLRKQRAGVAPEVRLDPGHYSSETTSVVYQALLDRSARALGNGHCVIADAVFARPEERQKVAATANACGANFTGVWLQAPEPVRRARVVARTADASDADAGVVRLQEEYRLGDLAPWHVLDAGAPLAELAGSVAILMQAAHGAIDGT